MRKGARLPPKYADNLQFCNPSSIVLYTEYIQENRWREFKLMRCLIRRWWHWIGTGKPAPPPSTTWSLLYFWWPALIQYRLTISLKKPPTKSQTPPRHPMTNFNPGDSGGGLSSPNGGSGPNPPRTTLHCTWGQHGPGARVALLELGFPTHLRFSLIFCQKVQCNSCKILAPFSVDPDCQIFTHSNATLWWFFLSKV